jgi:hypothetical protein
MHVCRKATTASATPVGSSTIFFVAAALSVPALLALIVMDLTILAPVDLT